MADGSTGSRTDPARVKEIFIAALDQPEAERGAYLDGVCGNDAALRREVEGLLSALADRPVLQAAILEAPSAPGESPNERDQPRVEAPGTRIGPYKLLELIGEGGFGSVFLAEQEEPVRRRVALKIIKLGMDTRQVVARFEQERQALALMDHPNIAKVLDAGATATGRPYFVMELVKGVTITTYCDEQNLSPSERLELFTSVCHAVQHAHQKGIIHRDIKPTNVLVSRHDDRPVVKVIDFGIAKATNARLTEMTVFTELRQMIGTPAHMSPEQAGLSDLDIDTRSDIYSLGVLLYELLTGTTPFDSKRLRSAAYGEIQRIIREEEPPKPSTRLSTMGDSLPSVAALRKTEPAKLRKLVRGDLDWIVMKCLEKDRTRRYETANGLAMEVQRYLAGEPVVAAPPRAAYRLRKFIRRNRGPVLAGALVVAALVLGLSGTIVGLVRAERARAGEAAQRQAAEAQRNKAERIAGFMGETLRGVGPSVARGRDTTVLKEMMNAAAERIEKRELEDNPEAEVQLRLTIGDVNRELDEYEAAERMLGPAVQLARATFGDEHAQVASALDEYGVLLLDQGRTGDALPKFEAAYAMRQRLFKGDHSDTAEALNNAAVCLERLGRPEEALPKYEAVLAMDQRLFGGDHQDIARGLNNVAHCLDVMGRSAEALPKYQASLDMKRRLFKGDHPAVAMGLNNLGYSYQLNGRAAEALPLFEAALVMRQRLFKGDHLDVATSLCNVAYCLKSLGRPAEALPKYEAVLAMTQRLFKGDHPEVATDLNNVATCLRALGRANEALPKYEAALSMRRRILPDGHNDIFVSQIGLGLTLIVLSRYAEAEAYLTGAYASLADRPGIAKKLKKQTLEGLVELYGAWANSEPGKGYDAKAAEWRAKLAAWQATTQPARKDVAATPKAGSDQRR